MAAEGMDLTPLRALVEAAGAESGALVDRIAALVARTRSHVATQANAALTLMNWRIGRMIDAEILQEGRAGYDQEIWRGCRHN